ncbi:hypothetical protein FW774_15520 [Pedobacter sp. BS3]|uniref:hypothetical protein n=1 Tax=Pedobacter sp. BS3 TaxID=2567937 RepID=UPI0011F04DEF|nr:hypothetical protein [Pedobacter sp. BS3]TZF82100.1 hypothetical protein FW774_15520 [Pedobacter sp. BS3]
MQDMVQGTEYDLLLQKVDAFIRKYYLNKVVRGCLYLAATLFASYVLVTLAEFYGNFSITIRTVLFYSFILLNLFILVRYVALPLSSYFKLGKIISHEQASAIIGQHFSNVQDKLLNTIQLKKLATENPQQRELIEASISQKTAQLRPIPFTSAINIQAYNKPYLKYALAPLLVLLLIAFTAPAIFSEGTKRLLKHDQVFVKRAPFEIEVLTASLKAIQGDDLTVKIKLKGNEIPQEVYLIDGDNSFKLEQENIIRFNYTFRNVQQSKDFYLQAGDYSFGPYRLTVRQKPTLLSMNAYLQYPGYLGRKNERIENVTDLTVPAGTHVLWQFKAQHTDVLRLTLGKTPVNLQAVDNVFHYTYRAMQDISYTLLPVNGNVTPHDSLSYKLTVIPDAYPTITVDERADSVNRKMLYFMGRLGDDHGLSKLVFHYKVSGNPDVVKVIPFDRTNNQGTFLYSWDVQQIQAKPGDVIEYFFEVYDNDAVNGPKASRSEAKTYKLLTGQETEKKIEATSQAVKQKMGKAISLAAQIENQGKRLNQDLLNKKELSYEDKKQVEQLLNKQKELEQLVNDIRKDNKQNLLDKQQSQEQRKEILEKQKQIEDLFNNVLDDKTKALLKKLQELIDQNNKEQTRDELQNMQMESKTLQKELDRILDLYKKLEFDQKLTEAIDKLKDLAGKQQQLSKQSEQKSSKADDLQQQQKNLNEDFNRVAEKLDELGKKNEELAEKTNYKNPEQQQQQIRQQQQQSLKSLNNRDMKKAAQSQQNAAEQMQQLSSQLEDMQQSGEEEENSLNLQDLRRILHRLVSASFEQEKLMQQLRNTNPNDPQYRQLTVRQKDIKDNLKTVQDSLYALSKRVPQIASVVNKEIRDINSNIDLAVDFMANRNTFAANNNQQYAMTAINNLALMLSEVEQKLQQAMKNAKGGGQGKQKSLSQLSKMQDELNKNMQKARQQMQGQQGQPQKPGQNGRSMSEQFAKMAREQQLIRQALQQLNQDLNKDGRGSLGNLDKLAKEMEQTETDLVNKKIQQQTLLRQQEILSKLLDAEKAEREREQDNKRESKQGKDKAPNYNLVLDEYKKMQQHQTELIKTVPPALNTFYKVKVDDYFRLLNSVK